MELSAVFLILLVLSLGLRHGLDVDHLATIDAISRTVRQDQKLAKLTGLLFSLGHGLIVILISLILGSHFIHYRTPDWLNTFGSGISIFFLLLFGLVNLINLLSTTQANKTLPTGLKSILIKKLLGTSCTAYFIIGIGALFAISFDTFTQVSLFSISATSMAGWGFSALLGIIFMIGMMITDGINGLLVSAVIKRADIKSFRTSQLLGAAICFFSLAVCVIEIWQIFH